MTKRTKWITLLGLLTTVCAAFCMVILIVSSRIDNAPFTRNHTPAFQEKTAHMVRMLNADDTILGACSGTAVGPHAILTADHCYKPTVASLRLDWARHIYKVRAVERDNNEHLIYLLDGPALTVTQRILTEAPKFNEPVFTFGFGGEDYPSTRKQGIVLDEYDPSELDAREGLIYTSLHVIPGDSGSAVYNSRGFIIGLVTFGINYQDHIETGIFPLRFTPEQIHKVETYEYKETPSVRHTDFDSFIRLVFPK